MSETVSSNRWWEGYLVRYFVPALFGIFVVKWILSYHQGDISGLFLNDRSLFASLDVVATIFLAAIGFLYCYIASYPVLVFHATRVVDFKNKKIATLYFFNPYSSSLVMCLLSYLVMCWYKSGLSWLCAYLLMLVIVMSYSFFQCWRLYRCYVEKRLEADSSNTTKDYSLAYAYAEILSRKRIRSASFVGPENETRSEDLHENRSDIPETYRHLREHGNTAFIVLLEIALCPVVFVALDGGNALSPVQWLVPVLVIWITPSVFVHWFAQHLERTFSTFD